jgi:hypothetical protein
MIPEMPEEGAPPFDGTERRLTRPGAVTHERPSPFGPLPHRTVYSVPTEAEKARRRAGLVPISYVPRDRVDFLMYDLNPRPPEPKPTWWQRLKRKINELTEDY